VERIVITRIPPGGAVDRLRSVGAVTVWPEDREMPRRDLLAAVGDATGLYAMLTDRVDRELFDAAPNLRVVSTMAVGVDNIDVATATDRGIAVGHTPDVLTETTADMAFALLLAAARRLSEGVDYVRADAWRIWDPELLWGVDLHGSAIGIVGLGRIGQAVARRAAGFAMTVVSHSRSGGVDLDELLAVSDHVVLTTALTTETRHLIAERELRTMKETATLVNVGRGGLVDSDALVLALREGWIFAAGLDVTDPEPMSADHPLVALPNCTIVPHLGSATHRTRVAMADLAADNLIAGLQGEPLPAAVC